jgi:hypothetical protein
VILFYLIPHAKHPYKISTYDGGTIRKIEMHARIREKIYNNLQNVLLSASAIIAGGLKNKNINSHKE